MPDTGLVRFILAPAGSHRTMMASGSLRDTGTAIAAGANTTITGTATTAAIFVNMTGTETTTVTSSEGLIDKGLARILNASDITTAKRLGDNAIIAVRVGPCCRAGPPRNRLTTCKYCLLDGRELD